MIATYIQELLATNNRVIVPNFGAFLVRATSKSKDANTLEEKLKDVYFSPFLKFNDELLEKYIIKKESVTKEQAAEKIIQFIEEVKKELEQEKPYNIKNFGKFEADKQGKVQFITIAKETPTEKETKETPKTTTTRKTSTTKKTTATKEPVAKAEEKKTDKSASKPEEKPKVEETKKEPVKAAETKKEIVLEEFKEEKKEIPPVAPKKEPVKQAAQTKPIYSYKKQKKPVNKGLVWAIAIGVPVAAIFIWALLNINTIKKVFNKERAKTEKIAQKKTTQEKAATDKKEEQVKKETPAKDVKKETTAKTEPKKQETKKPSPPQKKYYIIAGSFKNEKYAIAYMNKLKAEGYNAEKLSERNGMYAVSYNSFADKRKAIAEYKFLSQEKGLEAWILYF